MYRSRWKWMGPLLLLGLSAAWWAARPGFGDVHARASPPASTAASAEQMLAACEQQVRGLRLEVFAVEQELQHLDVERRLGGDRVEPTQSRRLAERSEQLGVRRQQLSGQLSELLTLADQLRELVAQQARASGPPPAWLHEARVRVRIDALGH